MYHVSDMLGESPPAAALIKHAFPAGSQPSVSRRRGSRVEAGCVHVRLGFRSRQSVSQLPFAREASPGQSWRLFAAL